MRRKFAKPRVIRGTQGKSLPLLPSGPGGVRDRLLHGARNLTSFIVADETMLGTMPLVTIALLLASALSPDIRRVLDDQQAAWNRGDIDAFMTAYENSAETMFIGKSMVKGYASVRANYHKRYPTPEAMGKLEFSQIEVKPLDSRHAYVTGRFHLARTDAAGGEASGIFSLLFEKKSASWKIILDHTS